MDFEQCKNAFIQYVKQFDLREKALMNKFHHAFRVMEYAHEIAQSLDLSTDDLEIVKMIGLFHDIGRFEQWTNYHTYADQKSVNHATLGVEIIKSNHFLERFTKDKEVQELILKSIQNHNQIEVKYRNERERLFTSIVRDADKLDILIEQNNQITTKNPTLNDKLVQSILKEELCQDVDLRELDEDYLLRALAFVFDIHFDYTIQYLEEKEIIKNKINLLEIYFENHLDVQKIKETMNTYIGKRRKIC